MKIKFAFILLSVLLVFPQVFAQSKSADEILKELSNKTNSYDNIKLTFAYTMDNKAADINETTNGTLLISGDKYRLNIAGQEIICDGITLWTYMADSEEVQVNEVDEEEGFSPNKLLSTYGDDYSSTKDVDINIEGKTYLQLLLKPRKENPSIEYVRLLIDADKMHLKRFTMYDFDGNSFAYDLKQFIPNTELPENTFSFIVADHPNVEVIDMR
ncbi:MAG: outer membrane lipoprotein carrier protein LolA [Bacteroidales bacterium]|nr:outer membrane lipoprotein carrier protein LolA [Bacteroidales bacterium]